MILIKLFNQVDKYWEKYFKEFQLRLKFEDCVNQVKKAHSPNHTHSYCDICAALASIDERYEQY